MSLTVEEQLRAGVVRMPTWSELASAINKLETERGEWCGFPMPLPGMGLVLESKHPRAADLAEIQAIFDGPDKPTTETAEEEEANRKKYEDLMGWKVVNRWRGRTPNGLTGEIVIARHEETGKTRWGLNPDMLGRNRMALSLFEALDAWSLETECTALDTLATLLTERMFKAYALTGAFLETSKRSGLTYWFRRLAPTLVLTPHRDAHEIQILCALCLHPLAYYATTRCGAMTPTDDVIAHLLLMRGDEHLYWRRANQHQADTPEAGL